MTEIIYAIKKRARKGTLPQTGSPRRNGKRKIKAPGDNAPRKNQRKICLTSGATANNENSPKGSIVVCRKDDVALTLEDYRFRDAVHNHLQSLEGKVYYRSAAKRVLKDIKEFGGRILCPLGGIGEQSPTYGSLLSNEDATRSEYDSLAIRHLGGE